MASSLAHMRCALYNMQTRIWRRAILFQGYGGDVDSRILFPVPYPPDDSQLPLDTAVDFASFEIADADREGVRRACAEILGRASSINEKQPISLDCMHMDGFEYFATYMCLRFKGNAVAYAQELHDVVVPDFVRFLSEDHLGSDVDGGGGAQSSTAHACDSPSAAADFVNLASIGYEIASVRRSIAVTADMLARGPVVFGLVPPQPDAHVTTLVVGDIRPIENACDALRFVNPPLRSYALRCCATAIARSGDGNVVLAAHMLDMSQLSIVYQATRRVCAQVSRKRTRRARGAETVADGDCDHASAFVGRTQTAAAASIASAAPSSRRHHQPSPSAGVLDPALSKALERATRLARTTTDRLLRKSAAYVFH